MLNKKRAIGIASIFLVLLCVLLARLVQIQLVSTESFSTHNINLIEESVDQRIQSIELDDGRGKFYDRFGTPINHEQIPTLILFPFLKKMNWKMDELADILNVTPSDILYALEKEKEPFVFKQGEKPIELTERQMDQINSLKIPGVFAADRLIPTERKLAQQLIGGLNVSEESKKKLYPDRELSPKVKVGDKGLQEKLDEYLLSEGESKLVYHVDAMGGPLFGINVKYLSPSNPLFPVKVKTTLDLNLQRAAEDIVDSQKVVKGGLILIDIETSEIRALVSRPHVNNKDPNEGLGSMNMMFSQATLGSVFKTVVAAAAIENDLVKDYTSYNCNLTIDGKIDDKQLGNLSFYDSFAQSCNRTFAELAVSLSKKDSTLLEQYAERLQLTGKSGWEGSLYHTKNVEQLYGEDKGRIWLAESKDKKVEKAVAQTAIGQKDVQVTPLAAANMMATIARNGERKMVKAVSAIEYANGTTAAQFEDIRIKGETIDVATAKRLQQLLTAVVADEKGTASLLQQLSFQVAGKTGTAQTDVQKNKLNKWFAGYFPVEKPKYAIVSVVLDVSDKDAGAVSLIKAYLEKVNEIEPSLN